MAEASDYVALGELLAEPAASSDDDVLLEKLKLVVQEQYPEGWTEWRVVKSSIKETAALDPQVLNKLRFALPTIEVLKVFHPLGTHVSEKSFRDIKVKMFQWPFTRALIMGPPAVANKIRGSAARTELFNNAMAALKPTFLSRKDAIRVHRPSISDSEDCSSASSQTRKRRSTSRSSIPSKKSKIDLLEEKVDGMFAVLLERLEKREETSRNSPINDQYPQHRYSMSEDDMDASSVASAESVQTGESWCAPEPIVEDYFLHPEVREEEPAIPEPTPDIKAEGIACQKLGMKSWNKIKYKDVEKRLKAAPVFSGLKVNPLLERYAQKSFVSAILLRLDDVLGTITHGLLRQRKALVDEIKTVLSKDNDLHEEMKRALSNSSSPFKSISDDLLHLACARRAEALDLRRKFFKAGTEFLSGKLQEIPPSEAFLFDEQKLSDFIKEEGGYHRVFPSRSGKTYRSSGLPNRKVARKRPSEAFAAPRPIKNSEPKWRSRPSASTSSFRTRQNEPASHAKKSSDRGRRQGKARRF